MTPESSTAPEAQKTPLPEHKAPPKRRKTVNPQIEAYKFLSAAESFLDQNNRKLDSRALLELQTMFRNYSANTGLRGKQKESVWNCVRIWIRTAKSVAATVGEQM